ncbi:MAG: 30S ribosomal protein S4 [Sphaerochaetaceae bacterium]|jgi:small subunit ribosomal protein S4
MAVSRAPVFKRCDYLGINPLVLGYTHKPSIRRKKPSRRKVSEYGLQLKEKQKVKFVYGVLEKQFKLTYNRAEKMAGQTGVNLLVLLESRFDNVVFRLGLATTRKEARQMVNHGHLLLNGIKVDIPSVTLRVGDVISVKDRYKKATQAKRFSQNRSLPPWLQFDEDSWTAKVVGSPTREGIDFDVTESKIVELYSK